MRKSYLVVAVLLASFAGCADMQPIPVDQSSKSISKSISVSIANIFGSAGGYKRREPSCPGGHCPNCPGGKCPGGKCPNGNCDRSA